MSGDEAPPADPPDLSTNVTIKDTGGDREEDSTNEAKNAVEEKAQLRHDRRRQGGQQHARHHYAAEARRGRSRQSQRSTDMRINDMGGDRADDGPIPTWSRQARYKQAWPHRSEQCPTWLQASMASSNKTRKV